MIKLLTIPLLLLCVACSGGGVRMARTAQQASLADKALDQQIRNDIALREQRQPKGCSSHQVKRVALQSSVRGVYGNLMTAREYWYIESCGRSHIYQVDYYGPIHANTPVDVKPLNR